MVSTDPVEVVEVPQLAGGRLHAWGTPEATRTGELDVPALPPGVDYVDVAGGPDFTAALRSDGQAVIWGMGQDDQPVVPPLPDGVRYAAVASGPLGFVLFLRTDGTVVGSGTNAYGQLEVPELPPGTWYTSIAATLGTGVAARSDGTTVSWGLYSEPPALPDGLRYTSFDGGMSHVLALRSDGRIVGWGSDTCGELDLPAPSPDAPYVGFAAGLEYSIALRADGTTVSRGCVPAPGAAEGLLQGPVIPAGETAVGVYVGMREGFAVTSSGSLAQWGKRAVGITVPARAPDGRYYAKIGLSDVGGFGQSRRVVALTSDVPPRAPQPVLDGPVVASSGGVSVWGEMPAGELLPPPPAGVRFTDVSVGEGHVALARSDGGGDGYGDDTAGATSVNPYDRQVLDVEAGPRQTVVTSEYDSPSARDDRETNVQSREILNHSSDAWLAAYPGDGFGLALRAVPTGTELFAYGDTSRPLATIPRGAEPTPVVDAAVGSRHAVMVLADGGLVAWGDPADGATAVPTAPRGQKFTAVDAGDGFSVALLSDGRLVGWGRNTFGQATPPAPPAGERFVSVDAGRNHAVALASDGTVHSWGHNDHGQTTVPAAPPGTRYTAVSAGGDTSAALAAAPSRTVLDVPAQWTGGPLPVKVTVSSAAGVPSGSVAITVDGRTATVLPLHEGTAITRVWSDRGTGGTHKVRAFFLGDSSVAPSSSATSTTTDGAVRTTDTTTTAPVWKPAVERLAGADRYTTAVAATQLIDPGTPVLYVASGEGFADALSAAPAATHEGGVLLLTARDVLPAAVKAEIERLAPRRIVVVGGVGAVSIDVEYELRELTRVVERIGGADRYETSQHVAERAFGNQVGAAVVADGLSFPDALAAGAAAGRSGIPVLLVPGAATQAPPQLTGILRSLGVRGVTIVGGPGAVSPGLERSIAGLPSLVGTERIGGVDRYATSVAINDAFFGTWHSQGMWSPPAARLATGTDFPDALSGAAVAGRAGEPLYIVPSTCVPHEVLGDLRGFGVATVRLLGGTGALSPAVEQLEAC